MVTTFDGEKFDLHPGLLRKGKAWKSAVSSGSAAGFFLLLAYRFGARCVVQSLLGGALVLTSAIFTLNRSSKIASAKCASIFVPIVMRSLGAAFAKIRTELLKNISGRVLDVGCADGQYLKYYVQSGKKVTQVCFTFCLVVHSDTTEFTEQSSSTNR